MIVSRVDLGNTPTNVVEYYTNEFFYSMHASSNHRKCAQRQCYNSNGQLQYQRLVENDDQDISRRTMPVQNTENELDGQEVTRSEHREEMDGSGCGDVSKTKRWMAAEKVSEELRVRRWLKNKAWSAKEDPVDAGAMVVVFAGSGICLVKNSVDVVAVCDGLPEQGANDKRQNAGRLNAGPGPGSRLRLKLSPKT
ncbi:hypothetical protein FQA39_LY10778 [Lamprigera yunnana]|nr:hypothetical protein FQA39_LY10778 [Lamprigera yunnana]